MLAVDAEAVSSEWRRRAADDLEAARLPHLGGLHALATFHAQQAAEKVLKGILIQRGRGLPRTHDLERLAAETKAPANIADAATFLTGFYVAGRYPDAATAVDAEDAREAIARAEEVIAWSQTMRS